MRAHEFLNEATRRDFMKGVGDVYETRTVKEAFTKGRKMNFEQALSLLRKGNRLTRKGWEDPRYVVTLENDRFKRVIKCKVAHYTHAKLRYDPTPNDILANDWELVK